jgi:hypothetical protein
MRSNEVIKKLASVNKKTFPTSTYIIVSDLCPAPISAKNFERSKGHE